MNLNATLAAQMVVFLILAWFTMKFVWPPLIKALDERASKIAAGLAAAEQGKVELESANRRADETLARAYEQGQQRIAEAEKRAQSIADEIKKSAQVEAARILEQAKSEADRAFIEARETLRTQLAALAVQGAQQILEREIDASAHAELLHRLEARL